MLRTTVLAGVSALGFVVSSGSIAAELEKAAGLAAPVQIQVAGKPLNVRELGHAAPFVCDFDGDGNFDLLVGVHEAGALRVYRNTGTNKEPAFEKFDLFQAGGEAGQVPFRQGTGGFTPQVIDFDGDGTSDVLSGCWSGELYLFKGQGKGKYAAGETLMKADGENINLGYSSTVFAADWNGDGLLDLLVGDQQGHVQVMLNEGEAKKPAYKTAGKLTAGGKPIRVGGSQPLAVDWDGDKKLDLLVGCSDGSVQWFKNEGTDKEPKLAAGTALVPISRPGVAGKDPVPGRNAKICAVDWNGDGKLDLLLGDFAYFVPDKEALTEADQKALKEAKDKLAELKKKQDALYKEMQDLRTPPLKKETPEAKAAREDKLKKAQAKLAELDKGRRKPQARYRELLDIQRQRALTDDEQAAWETVKAKVQEANAAYQEHLQKEVTPHVQPPPDETAEAKQIRETKLMDARKKLADLTDESHEPNRRVHELEGPKPGGSVWLFVRR